MSTDTPESVTESGPSTAVNVSKPITSVLALMDFAAQDAMKVGPRPAGRSPSLRSDELGRPSLSLQPGNIEGLDGFEVHKDSLGEAVTAMSEISAAVQKVIDAREASKRNPTWNEAAQVIHTNILADKLTTATATKVDAALRLLNARITDTESKLTQPLDASVASPVSAEVREYVRSLTAAKRNELIGDLIEKGDTKTLGALLGSGVPPFLSGLNETQVQLYTELHNRKRAPHLAQKLTVLKAASERLANAGSLMLTQMERAQGVNASVVNKLKMAQSKSEAAFR